VKFEGAFAAHQTAGWITGEDRDLDDATYASRIAGDMDNCIQRRRELGVQSGLRQPSKRRESLQTSRDIGSRIGVYGAATTFVASVHSGQQVTDFCTADLTDHQPVRAHPE
jgi:hypothetical protein